MKLLALACSISIGALLCGCADDNSDATGSGSSDAAGPGSGASGGSGGSGTGATGGDGGTSAGGSASGGSATGGSSSGGSSTGGSSAGGSGGVGGMGSGGGPSGGTPQCTDASQCTIVNDCCTCAALAPGEVAPPCNIMCLQPKCSELGFPGPVASCVVGQCVADFPCDHTMVVCAQVPPVCLPGQTPSVNGACWGACVDADECGKVASCAQCSGGQACVSEITQIGLFAHCVDPDPSCGGVATCACMGAAVCVGVFDSCADAAGEIQCSCPAC